MDTKTMTQLLVGFLIGAVILASMVPIFINVQDISGDEVTLENDTLIVLREVEDGDVLTCERTRQSETTWSDAWTLNDEPLTSLSGSSVTWNVGIMSDAVYMQINSSGNAAAGSYYDVTNTTPTTLYFGAISSIEIGSSMITTFSFSDGYAIVNYSGNETINKPYTWGYVVCPNEDGEYSAAVSGGVGLVKTADDVTLCGAYTSGDNDTMYYYHNGVAYVSNTDYTIDVSIETATHEGTTDIYDATVSVDIGGEEFTPYRILVPYEVEGHASGGALYSIIGILPLVAGVGLLMGAVYYFISRR